jgi:cytochrome oxidase assembly protein ShyY1
VRAPSQVSPKPVPASTGGRGLLTARWFGFAVLAVSASLVMVLLGRWQWSRYELRSAINERIDASTVVSPVPLREVLPPPGEAPDIDTQWIRVTTTGHYDSSQEILIRNRTAEGQVGYEVVTPFVLDDGSAVLVDRGWVPPDPAGMTVPPQVPPAPAGRLTLSGRVHLSESGSVPVQQRNGHWETRRVHLPTITGKLPYPVYGAYLLADDQAPGTSGLKPIPVDRENDWLNLGYAVQWWIFAAGALFALVFLARREIAPRAPREPRG